MNNKLSSKVNKLLSEQLSGQQLKFIVFTVLVCFYGYRDNNKGLSYNLKNEWSYWTKLLFSICYDIFVSYKNLTGVFLNIIFTLYRNDPNQQKTRAYIIYDSFVFNKKNYLF